jgi:hypothetical protein
MGMCCGKTNDNKVELLIYDIFLNHSNLCKLSYGKIEQLLLENSRHNLISLNDFSNKILPVILLTEDKINKEKEGYQKIISFYCESIFLGKSFANIYFIILILFPLIPDTNIRTINNYFKTFSKLNSENPPKVEYYENRSNQNISKSIIEERFQLLFLEYLSFNLRTISLCVLNNYPNCFPKKEEKRPLMDELDILIHKIFTHENILEYANKFISNLDKENHFPAESSLITLDDFKDIFYKKHFLFDFIEMRKNFLQEYMYTSGIQYE